MAGLSEKQREEMRQKSVKSPAITMIGMTTPSTLYESLSSAFVADGFLNRIIIVTTNKERPKARRVSRQQPSERLVDWVKHSAAMVGAKGNLAGLDGPQFAPHPTVIPFTDDAFELLDSFDDEIYGRMNDHDKAEDGMTAMWGRTREIAMRLALIIAHSCGSKNILPEHLKWAIDYVRHYTIETIQNFDGNMGEHIFDIACKKAVERLKGVAPTGLTRAQLSNDHSYRKLQPHQREAMFGALVDDYGVQAEQQDRGETRGRPTIIYVIS